MIFQSYLHHRKKSHSSDRSNSSKSKEGEDKVIKSKSTVIYPEHSNIDFAKYGKGIIPEE